MIASSRFQDYLASGLTSRSLRQADEYWVTDVDELASQDIPHGQNQEVMRHE